MNYHHYIGIDVSKHSIDCTVLRDGELLLQEKVSNTPEEIRLWLKKIMKDHRAGGRRTLYCVEHMGTYTKVLIKELVRRKLSLWLESPLHISLTLGLQRGKSDKLDSLRIAQYAYTYRNKVRLWHQPREVIEHLKLLRSLRERLNKAIKLVINESKEVKSYFPKKLTNSLDQHCMNSMASLKSDITATTNSMMEIIHSDERLKDLYIWLLSVQGIGQVLAIEMLIATNEFKNFTSPKKFACHCGVVPFRYTSGTSLNSKAKVSKRANQRMKALLHMAAMSVIRFDGDCKQYYQRKLAQGKSKMSVLNVIRNVRYV